MSPIRRSKPSTRRQRRRVLIVCGGKVTEPEYFRFVKAQTGATGVAIKSPSESASPLELLQLATRLRRDDAAEAARENDEGDVYDAVWVVCDVDDFGGQLDQLLRDAERAGIGIALSNPCFELWLIWHVDDLGCYLTTRDAQQRAARAGVVRGKSIVSAKLNGGFEAAERRASAQRERHIAQQDPPMMNPHSGVDVLVRYLVDQAAAACGQAPGL